MTFAELCLAVTSGADGYASASTSFSPEEIVLALNRAQRDVGCDMLSLADRLPQTDAEGAEIIFDEDEETPIDSKVDPTALSYTDPPTMLADESVEPVLPAYMHNAIVTKALVHLSPKFGDIMGRQRVLPVLMAQYNSEIKAAQRVGERLRQDRRTRVEDAYNTTRFLDAEF